MTFDNDADTGTGGLGGCGDVDDGIGSDVSVHESHNFLTVLCKTTGISIIAAQVILLTYRKHDCSCFPLGDSFLVHW